MWGPAGRKPPRLHKPAVAINVELNGQLEVYAHCPSTLGRRPGLPGLALLCVYCQVSIAMWRLSGLEWEQGAHAFMYIHMHIDIRKRVFKNSEKNERIILVQKYPGTAGCVTTVVGTCSETPCACFSCHVHSRDKAYFTNQAERQAVLTTQHNTPINILRAT